jgi:hypothetical protein
MVESDSKAKTGQGNTGNRDVGNINLLHERDDTQSEKNIAKNWDEVGLKRTVHASTDELSTKKPQIKDRDKALEQNKQSLQLFFQ